MRTQFNVRAGFLALVLSATLLSACNWQIPENVRFRGSPQLALPLGSADFDFDDLVNVTELVADFESALADDDEGFDSAEKTNDAPLTLEALRKFPTGDITDWPDADVTDETLAEPLTIGPIDISEIFGPFPNGVDFQSVPLMVGLTGSFDGSIKISLTADYGGSQQHDFGSAYPATNDNTFQIEAALNDRPSDLELNFEVTIVSGNPDNIDSIDITLTLPFEFTAEPGTALDLSGDDEDDEDFVFDDDIFGRDPDDPDKDLNDFVDSLRGSNATVSLTIENTVGFTPIIRMLAGPGSQNEGTVIFETEEPSQSGAFDLVVEITGSDFNEMIDSNPFYPKFEFLLPQEFQLNDGGALIIESGYLSVQARMDYTFTFDREDD